MITNGGLLGTPGSNDIPRHYTVGNLLFDDFMDKFVFKREIGIMNLSFIEQCHAIYFCIGDLRSLLKDFSSPIHVIIQLQGELLNPSAVWPG